MPETYSFRTRLQTNRTLFGQNTAVHAWNCTRFGHPKVTAQRVEKPNRDAPDKRRMLRSRAIETSDALFRASFRLGSGPAVALVTIVTEP